MLKKLPRLGMAMLALPLILVTFLNGVTPAKAATLNDVGYPFAAGQTWYVFEGYDWGSHTGNVKYAFDLVKDYAGNYSTGAENIYAPVTGTVSTVKRMCAASDNYTFLHYNNTYSTPCSSGELNWEAEMVISLSDGSQILLAHFVPNVSAGQSVTKGQLIGTLGQTAPGFVNHLHFQYRGTYLTAGVWNFSGGGTQCSSGSWYTVDSAPQYIGCNGKWSGTQINVPYANSFNYDGSWYTGFGEASDQFLSGDFTGDSRSDVVVITKRSNLDGIANNNDLAYYVLRGNELNFQDNGRWQDSYGIEGDKILVGDFAGDDKADLLVGHTRNNSDGVSLNSDYDWYLLTSNGSSFVDGGRVLISFGYGVAASGNPFSDLFFAADIDGNGKDDLVRGDVNFTGSSVAWSVKKSNGSSFGSEDALISSFGEANDRFYFADANADDKADLYDLNTREDGTFGDPSKQDVHTWISLSNGTSTDASLDSGRRTVTGFGLDEDVFFVRDFNGDRRADVVAAASRTITGVTKPTDAYTWYVAEVNSALNGASVNKKYDAYGIKNDKLLAGNFKKENINANTVDFAAARDTANTTGAALEWWMLNSKF